MMDTNTRTFREAMRETMYRLTIALVGVLVVASLVFGQDNGSVYGTVVYDSGTPVKGATVYADPLD